ncbi:nucleotide-sugar transporter-domain-containing protein [Collybia nuda]|uniref:Nucleotide-sugar transporter-domain-containing protein n=1 Tax=Collybia nuda TaxID=64659 RepID=A0A9P5YBS5_9AGAR|nr:nucleotide-sugar transporter-domain-containing protein [Collybia nuda]
MAQHSNAVQDHDYHEELALPSFNGSHSHNEPILPSICGIPLKHISLVTLAVQNSLLTIIMHYSRVSAPPSRTYSAATAVLMNEILKGLISLVIAYIRIDTPQRYISPYPLDGSQATGASWTPLFLFRIQELGRHVFSSDCWKLSIPAILYVIQNNLQYVAASNLEAATFQVTYQMKILTTAAFSVLLLRRRLSPSQWLALLFLAIGVGVVQIQAGAAKVVSVDIMEPTDVRVMDGLRGFMAVAAACFTSGLAGVYFEMVLKNSQADLWVRNVQLSLFSILPALAPIVFSHTSNLGPSEGWSFSLFHDFGAWAWATVSVQVLGGLVTAMVIKYSDNILKGFATSLSIIISFLASTVLFNFNLTLTFALGSVIVLVATWLYNQPPKRITNTDNMLRMTRTEKSKEASYPSRSSSPSTIYKAPFTSSTSSLSSLALSSPSPSNESALPYGQEKLTHLR